MQHTKDLDDDGFELKFEDDITKEEKMYYVGAYPNVNMIADRRVHCTSCDDHIGTAPASGTNLRMHSILQVTQCKRCHRLCQSGEYVNGDNGKELACRWCGQRGGSYSCSNCSYVFCKKCILRNFSHSTLQHIKNNQSWDCFACAPESILPLRAQYWALWNFFAKQKLMIEKQAKAGRCYVEIMNALKHDSSTCCPHLYSSKNKTKKSRHIDVGGMSSNSDEEWQPSRTRKRRRIESSEGSSEDASQRKESSPSCSIGLNDAVRKVNDDSSSESIELISDSSVSRAQNSVQIDSSTTAQPIRIECHSGHTATHQNEEPPQNALAQTFLITVTTTSNGPIYHTINGHQIELNSAAQQNPIRMPDGKIVHVRKLSTNAAVTESAPTFSQPLQIQHEIGQHSVTQFQSLSSLNSSQAFQQFTASSMSYSMQSTEPLLGPRKYATDPVGDACTQFERQIFNAVEICRTTEVKLRTLMNSNAYKTVRNVNDIKELLIHMSYLLTFTLARYKALQDSCIDDLRKLGFRTEADSLSNGKVIHKYGSESDVNEVEIVEPKHTTINLDDSDDEQAKKEEAVDVNSRLAADIAAPTSITAIRLPKVDRESTAGGTRREHDVIVMVLPNDELLATTHPPFHVGLVPYLKSNEPLKIRDKNADENFSDNIRQLFEELEGEPNERDSELNTKSAEQAEGIKTNASTKKVEPKKI